MPTLKRKNADGTWEYIQITGQDVVQMMSDLDGVKSQLNENWVFASTFKTPTNTWKEAIESAINTADSSKTKTVFLPPELQIHAPVVITKSNIKFVGFGTVITTVSTLTANIPYVFTNGSVDIEKITFEGITFKGGQYEAPNPPMRYRDDAGATVKHSFSFDSAIKFIGSLTPYASSSKVVKDVTIRKCNFYDSYGLPTYLCGLKGHAKVTDCRFDNCLDVGFLYNEKTIFTNNNVTRSHDNGVSISRGTKQVVCVGNTVDQSAYAGIWIAGWEDSVNVGSFNSGPFYFSCTGNVVTNSGQHGIKLVDAPQWGTVSGNTIHTVFRGPMDEPQDLAGIGITVAGFPYGSAPAAPTQFAKGINISGNTIVNANRGGIKAMGCYYIHISDNLVIDAGTQYYVDGTTAIGSTNKDQNFGISLDNAYGDTINQVYVRDNTIIDSRVTPFTNYPLVATASHYSVFEGNKYNGTRQNLTAGLTQDTNRTNVFENRILSLGSGNNAAMVAADLEGYRRMGFYKRVGQNPSITYGSTLPFEIYKASTENIDDPAATYTKMLSLDTSGQLDLQSSGKLKFQDVSIFREGGGLIRTEEKFTAAGGLKSQSTWNGGHLEMGGYRMWWDAANRFRYKTGGVAPTSDTDGTVLASAPATSISSTPTYVGQIAVVSGVGYLATGTSSAADWKQITN